MDQDETWQAGRPQPWPHCVRWGPSSSPRERGHSPQFSAHACYGEMAGWIKMPISMEVGLGPGDFVLHGNPAPPQRKRAHLRFLAHVYCGQMARWIKMPRGTEVNLGPGDVVLDGVPAPPKRGTAPSFRTMSIVAKRLDG